MNNNNQLRSKTLREINAWCYERASHLSLTGNNQAASPNGRAHGVTVTLSPKNAVGKLTQLLFRGDVMCHISLDKANTTREVKSRKPNRAIKDI